MRGYRLCIFFLLILPFMSCAAPWDREVAALRQEVRTLKEEVERQKAMNPALGKDIGEVQGRYQIVGAGSGAVFLIDTSNGRIWHASRDPKTGQVWWEETVYSK